ncbi:MAG: hypothetical protein K8F53_14645 [Rhodocyclaceae bacterium]|nr:hypothetical protein [Rhodocyclaceae bacterium]
MKALLGLPLTYFLRLVPLVLRLAVCVKAEAATLLTAAGVLGLLNNLLALLATCELVFSFFAISITSFLTMNARERPANLFDDRRQSRLSSKRKP